MKTRTKQQPFLMRAATTALLAVLLTILGTQTAWADAVNLSVDNDFAEGTAGHYYVNMPTGDGNVLTISDSDIAGGKGTFKFYDNGGKGGNYSDGFNGYLVIIAPEGYKINLAGSIAINSYDEFGVWEGSDTNNFGTELLYFSPYYTPFAPEYSPINITSGGNSFFIWFSPNGSGLAGWDLTVTLEELPDYGINVATAANGSVAASVGGTDATTAKESQTVTLTATPGEGYLLADLSVTCGGEAVELDWDVWTNSATFTMPDGDVTVTPTFTTKSGLFAIIPKTGTRTVTFPEGVTSFKVYDDGGPDGDYSANCDGWLEINLPDGYHFHLSGSVTTDATTSDRLSIYVGDRNHERQRVRSDNAGVAKSFTYDSDEAILLCFLSNDANQYAGLDLTVTLVGASYTVTVNNADNVGGSVVTASVGGEPVTSATAGRTVILTASPAEGYVLGALSVRDADGNIVDVNGDMLWYTDANTVTFTMPNSDVTVTPVFTNVMTAEGGLTVNMLKESHKVKSVTIPSGVTSFKVYDYGGADCNYSDDYSSHLRLTAPEGCVLQLSGTITTQSGNDYLTVYDGYSSGDFMLNHVSSTGDGVATAIPTVVSTEREIFLTFRSDASVNYAGLDLTVTVISPGTDYSVSVATAEGGTMQASTTTAQLGDVVTLTASPSEGYVLSDLSVTCGGAAVKTDWNVWTNSATFKMPNGPVTVTPTFTDDLDQSSLAVNLPAMNNFKFVTIPEGVTSFKIYDDGGPDGNYAPYCWGKLRLSAPEGSLLRFTGSIAGPEDKFHLTIADKTFTASKNDIDITTTGDNPTFGLSSNYSDTGAGLDLTATVLYAVNLATGIANGTVTTDKANAATGETVTLTVTPATDCTIGSVSINGEPLEAVGGVYSFTMPARTVTVSVLFRKLLTNADITVADIPAQPYDGTALTPVITVTDGTTPLTLGTDYTVSPASYTDPGDHTVTITGIGNYEGTVNKTFTIIPWSGAGTEGNPYMIYNKNQLDLLAHSVNGTHGETADDFNGVYFKLGANITYDPQELTIDNDNDGTNDSNYEAIGNGGTFNGHFNGDNKTISGIRIYKGGTNTGDKQQGLFGVTGSNASIYNLNLVDADITGYSLTGGIAGYNSGSVSNCHVAASVIIRAVQDGAYHHGGIVGFNLGTITHCTSSATLAVGDDVTNRAGYGGIAGNNDETGKLIDNLVIGAVVPTAGNLYGAICGYNRGTIARNYYRACTVANSENATGVGCNKSDVTDDNGAVSIHTLTLGTGITTTSQPVINIDNTDYYAGTITLSGGLPDDAPEHYTYAYTVNGNAISGNTFAINADATVGTGLYPADWATESEGSEGAPYMIYNKDQLDLLAHRVNGTHGETANDYENKYFKLGADIIYNPDELTIDNDNDGTNDINYEAIGSGVTFNGHFDGGGHTVSGIRIYSGGTYAYAFQGLFGITGSSANIHDVTLADADITGDFCTGGIVGANEGTVSDCHVAASVIVRAVQDGAYQHGGIVGRNRTSGTVTHCTSAATLTIADGVTDCQYYGGIAGVNEGSLTDNLATGAVVPAAAYNTYGAISGVNDGTLQHNYYTACTVANVKNATGVGCGGIYDGGDYTVADITDDDGAVPALRDNADNTKAIALLAALASTTDNHTPVDLGWGEGQFPLQLVGRTLYKDGAWNTLCLPFNVTIEGSVLDGAEVKTLTGSAFAGGTLTLNFSTTSETTLTAGKPYLVRWTKPANYVAYDGTNAAECSDLVNPIFNGVTVSTATANVETDCVDFIGILSPTVLYEDGAEKTNLYMGAANKLYYPTVEGFRLNACRGYFKLKGVVVNGNGNDNGNENAVRSFDINFGEETTGIVEMRDEKGEMRNGHEYEDGGWYTVDGRRLDGKPTRPGLYIHNGRKVVVQ